MQAKWRIVTSFIAVRGWVSQECIDHCTWRLGHSHCKMKMNRV